MAYPIPQQEGITKEQAEILRELNSFHQVSESAAWKLIFESLQKTVDVARDELLACEADADMASRSVLALRWQEREAIRRGLVKFMDSHLEERNRILEEIKEQHEYTDDHSGDPGNHSQ